MSEPAEDDDGILGDDAVPADSTAAAELDAKRLRRSIVRVSTLAEQGRENDLEGTTAAERIAMVWPLTLQVWAFSGKPFEPRLQRHIVRVFRR